MAFGSDFGWVGLGAEGAMGREFMIKGLAGADGLDGVLEGPPDQKFLTML
jgi:hypothetical protein